VSVTGLNSILPKEHGNKFYNLPIIRHLEKDVCSVAAWDSSIHDSIYLNRVTEGWYQADFVLWGEASCSLVDWYTHFTSGTLVPAYPTAWFQITEYRCAPISTDSVLVVYRSLKKIWK
jgi:hypothetical protein